MRKGLAALIVFLLLVPASVLAESIQWQPQGSAAEINLLSTTDYPSDSLTKAMYRFGIPVDTWQDPVTGMEFVWIPGGCFQMGQSAEEKAWIIAEVGKPQYERNNVDELPRHEVCVDGFWMSKYEVTRGQYRKFAESTGYKTVAEKKNRLKVLIESTKWKWKELSGYSWRNVGFEQNDDHPVTALAWGDAKVFTKWMQEHSDGRFRLPTEAEWEHAARAVSRTFACWGKDPSEAYKYGNVADETSFPGDVWRHWTMRFDCEDGYWATAPVGSYRPNAYGLYDMMGNVWEWCEDWYDANAYSNVPKNNPLGGNSASGERVLRGGSWTSSPVDTRFAIRDIDSPNNPAITYGFRVVRLPRK